MKQEMEWRLQPGQDRRELRQVCEGEETTAYLLTERQPQEIAQILLPKPRLVSAQAPRFQPGLRLTGFELG